MNTEYLLRAIQRIAFTLFLVFAFAGRPTGASDANPPDRMTYQGNVVDANGTPLGNTTPQNYDVVFRIYDVSQGGIPIWSEQQTVTVDKGNFSVLLGEGSTVANENRPLLSAVFTGPSASDRYMSITVKNLGGSDVEIAPRLRLLPSPYALLAKNAVGLVSNDGQALATVASGTLEISAPVTISGSLSAATFSGNGASLGQINATNITAGTLGADRVPGLDGAKIAAGTISDDRLSSNIPRLNVNASFAGNVNAASFSGFGTIPIGGIIMWSGTTANVPTGWALCDGRTVSQVTTPDLRSRFIIGAGENANSLAGGLSFYSPGAKNQKETVTLGVGNLPPHSHQYEDAVFREAASVGNFGSLGSGYRFEFTSPGIGNTSSDTDNNGLAVRDLNTLNTGSGIAFDIRPSYYALAFIMRVQ